MRCERLVIEFEIRAYLLVDCARTCILRHQLPNLMSLVIILLLSCILGLISRYYRERDFNINIKLLSFFSFFLNVYVPQFYLSPILSSG
jgi:hypothetical protein